MIESVFRSVCSLLLLRFLDMSAPELATIPRTVNGLRAACGTHLDIPFSHSVLWKGTWKSMSVDEMAEFYDSRQKHMKGQKAIEEWQSGLATPRRSNPPGGKGVGVAYAFWYALGDTKALPWVAVNGLTSAVQRAGFDKVVLLTYQDLINVPRGIEVQSAQSLLSLDSFLKLLRNGEKSIKGFIAPLSDYVRLLACSVSGADASWLIDCDTLWLRSALMKYYVGHCFGTFQQNPKSYANRDMAKRLIKLTLDYCKVPRDYLKPATPYRFPKGSPMLAALVESLGRCFPQSGMPIELDGSKCTDYNFVMGIVKQHVNDFGLRSAYTEPMVFSPVPYFAWQKPLESGSVSCGRE
jgi:hypothetical protein